MIRQIDRKANAGAAFHWNAIEERTTVSESFRSTRFLGGYGGEL